MDPNRLPKHVAEAMSRDISAARRKLLRKMTIEECYLLMVLADDLLSVAQMNWLTSLSNRYERGQHHLGTHLGIEDPQEVQALAQEIADDMREMRNREAQIFNCDVSEDRLREAEELLARYGVKLALLDRGQVPKETFPN